MSRDTIFAPLRSGVITRPAPGCRPWELFASLVLSRRPIPLVLAIALFGCWGDSGREVPPVVHQSSPSRSLPRLRERVLDISDAEAPLDAPFELAVTEAGAVTYVVGVQETPHFRTVDTSGAVIARFGRLGEGPGEARIDGNLFSLDSGVLFVSPADRIAVVYGALGEVKADVRNFESYLPIAAWGNQVLIHRDFRDHTASFVEAVRSGDRTGKQLVPQSDPFLRALGRSAHGPWPAAAWDGTRLVLGEGVSSELVLYSPGSEPRRFGRKLPPRLRTTRELEEADSDIVRRQGRGFVGPDGRRRRGPDWSAVRRHLPFDTLAHFVRGGLGFDAEGRLWVVGQAHDSTFADVFADTVFLGRLTVDCADRRLEHPTAVKGRWLAITCVQGDGSYRIRLFHIEDP